MDKLTVWASLWAARSEEYRAIAENCHTDDGRASFLALAERCDEHTHRVAQMAWHDPAVNSGKVANGGVASGAMAARSPAVNRSFVRAMVARIDLARRRSRDAAPASRRSLFRLVEEIVRELEDSELAIVDTWIARWGAEARRCVNGAQLDEALHAVAFALFPPECRPRLSQQPLPRSAAASPKPRRT